MARPSKARNPSQKNKTASSRPDPNEISCSIAILPPEEVIGAADDAKAINPQNAPVTYLLPAVLTAVVDSPANIAVLTSKYWGKEGVNLGVGFMDNPNAATRKKILAYMNLWGNYANVKFYETTSSPQVRIDRGPSGYWSYLGTDILRIPANKPTMNLAGFTERTPDAEYNRVVTHEVGHTLGFPHEHMRAAIISQLDYEKTIAYFARTQGWSRQEVINQVLTPLEERTILATQAADENSVMCYQLPGSITKTGKPILGGSGITAADGAFAGQIYPRSDVVSPPPPPAGEQVTINIWGATKIEIPGYKVTKIA